MTHFYYCSNCLTTSLRPNAYFIDGVCSACNFSLKNTSNTNTAENYKFLINKIKNVKKDSKTIYDCALGVSGGKDSLRQALWVRDHLLLNPLLVCCSYPPTQMSHLGALNLENLIEHGFDLEIRNPAPSSARRLSRYTFFEFGNVCKASEMALVSSLPKCAIENDIKIAFFGENPALQEGDYATLGVNEIDASQLGQLNTLQNENLNWIAENVSHKNHIDQYLYPLEDKFLESQINMYYLGPVWNDWGIFENALFSVLNGLEVRVDQEKITGDLSNASMLDEDFTNINMMIKYYKFGFGRATDFCNELIRNGKLTRFKAVDIVKEFDGICGDQIINKYCLWIGITVEVFWNTLNCKFVNKDLFDIDLKGLNRPKPKFKVG
jgi:N-acetyl sugar amidotransferase